MPFNQSLQWLHRQNQFSARSHAPETLPDRQRRNYRKAALCLCVFLTAFGVRFFQWQDQSHLAVATHMSLSQYYVTDARPLVKGDVGQFLTGPRPPDDATVLTHPPGYPILYAAASTIFGNPNTPLQILQIIFDATAAALVFLIAAELLSTLAGLMAGLLIAFSPQLGFYSLLILPDSLVSAPILFALLLTFRSTKQPRLWRVVAAGALVGISCWLRSNALLLAPLLAALMYACAGRGRRIKHSLALVGAAVLVIAPITIRNAFVFQHFIPVSLGTGITLIEGIGESDAEGRFGLPDSDMNVQRQEAELYGRPEYITGIYDTDGIERERLRLQRGAAVIRSHPFWFANAALRRVGLMLQFQDTTMPEFKIRPNPPVAELTQTVDSLQPAFTYPPAKMISTSVIGAKTRVRLEDAGTSLNITGDFFPLWGDHLVSEPVRVKPDTTYVFRVPVKLETGRAIFSVMSADLGTELAAVVWPDPVVVRDTAGQPQSEVLIPFTSGGQAEVCIVIRDGAMGYQRLDAQVGTIELFDAGPTAFSSSRYPRILINCIQRVLNATWLVPFAALGVVLLLLAGRGREVVWLLAVPAYYLGLQSLLHAEPRYILPVIYFLTILAALPVCWTLGILARSFKRAPSPCVAASIERAS
ncbi:MAG: glycosyltransferase family 39 protein [Pyrinomonadaceae bacterium]